MNYKNYFIIQLNSAETKLKTNSINKTACEIKNKYFTCPAVSQNSIVQGFLSTITETTRTRKEIKL